MLFVFTKQESGQGLMEYALIQVLVAGQGCGMWERI